jgi:formamidopyrimidine-DNA glycosylase
MPELPELEVLRRDLEKEIVGRRIKEVEVRPGSNAMKVIKRHGRRKEFAELLEGAKVDSIDRVGKHLLLELDSDRVLVVNMGPAGRLVKTSASGDMVPHTHVVIGFTIGGQLRYIDAKHQGSLFVTNKQEAASDSTLRSFQIDPLDNHPITWLNFGSMLSEHAKPIRELLTDDCFVVGLGDMYADEILFTAGLRPDRSSDQLGSQDVRRLYRALLETMQDSVKARGTSWGDDPFSDLQGTAGGYQVELKVYGRDSEPCRRCRQPVVKEKIGGADAYLCQQCQS